MKLKILKKSIKEGVSQSGSNYSIKSLFVSFSEFELYQKISAHLQSLGASIDQVEKFIGQKDYKGELSFSFGLNCSSFTFDHVERFGILDATIVFAINEKGYINAKIQVIDRKEQVNGYEKPEEREEEEVEGWNVDAPEIQKPIEEAAPTIQPLNELADITKNANVNDLPF